MRIVPISVVLMTPCPAAEWRRLVRSLAGAGRPLPRHYSPVPDHHAAGLQRVRRPGGQHVHHASRHPVRSSNPRRLVCPSAYALRACRDEDFAIRYPQRTSIERLPLSSDADGKYIDLGPYFHASPYTVTASMPLPRVFEVFRYMGLRHLPVLDGNSNIVGMVTREELTG